jgi:branched-subunit amino acid aminotransferase/4-amino-4-deoxychorismate lyase
LGTNKSEKKRTDKPGKLKADGPSPLKENLDSVLNEPLVCLNGTWLRESKASIPVENRGMMYGDGLFETMLSVNGQVMLLDLHLKRLNKGLDYLGIDLQISSEEWGRLFKVGIKKNGHLGTQHILRLQCWRNGGRGYPSTSAKGSWFLSYYPMPDQLDQSSSLRLMKSSFHLPVKAAEMSTLKSSNALLYVLAATEAQRKGYDDALLCTENGYIGENSSANIFWINNQTVYTPSINCGIIRGTRRDALLAALHSHSKFSIQEGLYHIESLYEAEVVFSTSTIKGIQPIQSLNEIQLGKDEDSLDMIRNIYQSTIS